MIDRSISPPIYPIGSLTLPPLRQWTLDNGLPVYSIVAGTQEVVRIELILPAGRTYELSRMASRAATVLLREGSRHHTAAALAEHFDFYGASINFPFNLDSGNAVLYSLNRHLEHLLPVWAEMLLDPLYPEAELRAYCRRQQSLLRDDLENVDLVAYREVTEKIFGDSHPYGYNTQPADYATLQREDIVQHHQRCFVPAGSAIIISGRVTPAIEKLLNQYFGQWKNTQPAPAAIVPNTGIPRTGPPPPDLAYTHLHRIGAVQTALRVGRRTFDRRHPDYGGLYLLHNLLGGYFGSRLMENIREDKGYTYGISSSLDTQRYDGCLYIDAEVSNDNVAATLREVRHEMTRLCEETVGDEELAMVRNYLMGSFLNMLDGPFNLAELVRTIVVNDLPLLYFDDLVTTVRETTAGELRTLAQRYLDPNDWLTVEVGP